MPQRPTLYNASLFAADEQWRGQLIQTRDGLKDCRENVIYILNGHPGWKGVLAADIFAKRIVIRKDSPLGHVQGEVWGEDDDVRLGLWLTEREHLVIRNEETIARAVGYVAREAPVHPLREFLRSIKWDKKRRVDAWATTYLGAPSTQYVSRVGRYFLLNMIRRAFEPGCVMRSVPVLEGPQNIGKSTISRLLAQPWFADTAFDLSNKDAYQVIQGIWLYEVSELDSFGKADTTKVKAFVSSTLDRYRAPYERNPRDQPRETCFVATTNASEYLRDWTGNTRFWPIACGVIDLEGFTKVREQLLAEALAIYDAGGDEARSYPTRQEEMDLFQPEQDARMALHPWFNVIDHWLEEHGHIDAIGTSELMKDCLHMSTAEMGKTPGAPQVIGSVMKRLGWERKRAGRAGRDYKYHRPEKAPAPKLNPDEVPF